MRPNAVDQHRGERALVRGSWNTSAWSRLQSAVKLIADLIPLLVLMCSSPFQLLAHYNCIINSTQPFFSAHMLVRGKE